MCSPSTFPEFVTVAVIMGDSSWKYICFGSSDPDTVEVRLLNQSIASFVSVVGMDVTCA